MKLPELPANTPLRNTTLAIYNANARQVISCRITELFAVIDIHALPPGIDFARIINDRTVMAGKFIKR